METAFTHDLTCSIVRYESPLSEIDAVIDVLKQSALRIHLTVVDNSGVPTDSDRWPADLVSYWFAGANLGYGKGHNLAIEAEAGKAPFHLIMNADCRFAPETLSKLYDFMRANPDIGLVMPKILNRDGSVQHLCKLLPTPMDLIVRRFLPRHFRERRAERYELRFTGYDRQMDVPCLSGCFMFVRSEPLSHVGGFDDRFFLYMEDFDLCRRIGQCSRTVFNPDVSVTHDYAAGSYRIGRLMMLHIRSAIQYFNKWGWIDFDRSRINSTTLKNISTNNSIDYHHN